MATELKFAVLFQAVDQLSDKFTSIGSGITRVAERASQGGERIAQLGERMTSFGEKMSLVTALVSEGASTMREWTESLSEPAMAMEHSFATMSALTDLSSKAMGEVREHAVAFSNTHPGVTANQWADGFRQLLGVYGDTAKAMQAEDVGAMLQRFGLDGQSAIHLLASAQTAYGISAQKMGDQFFRTLKLFPLANENARQYSATIGRLGGFAQTSNTPLSQMNAIVGEATQFMGSRGLTTIQTLFSGLQQAVAEGKSDIDISHGALNALSQIRDQMRGMSGTEKIGYLKDIGISATDASMFLPFISNLDKIKVAQKQIESGADTLGKGYAKATANATDLTKKFHQNIDNLYDAIYTPALPTLNRWLGDLTGVTQGATAAAEKHSTIMRIASVGITVFGTGVYSAVSAMSSLGAASVFFGEGMKAFSKLGKIGPGILSFGSSLLSAIPAITTFGAALLANPLTWYIGGVLLLAGAAYEIYEHWGAVSGWFSSLWSRLRGIFSGFSGWASGWAKTFGEAILIGITGPFGLIAVEIYKHWDAIKASCDKIAGGIKGYFVGHSPPPFGPLHDLGHITIAETIADRIRPAPILSAITRTAAAVAIAAPLMAMPAAGAFGPGREPAAIAGSAGAAPIIHYAPVINAAGLSEEALLRTLETHAYELRRILNREDERRERTELK